MNIEERIKKAKSLEKGSVGYKINLGFAKMSLSAEERKQLEEAKTHFEIDKIEELINKRQGK